MYSNYQTYWKEPKNHLKMKVETLLWSLRHPVVACIYFAPKNEKVNNFIDKHFSERTISKVHDCPSCMHRYPCGTAKLILMILTNQKFKEVR